MSTIRGSSYLTWITVYIMLNTIISSIMYFEKSMASLLCLPHPGSTVLHVIFPGSCLSCPAHDMWHEMRMAAPDSCRRLQVVASAASDSASRMAIFATINSVSAIVIAALQLFATGFLLTRLQLPAALAASALFAAGHMAVIAVHPSPVIVGGGEVIRKVSHLYKAHALLGPTSQM